MHIASFVRRHFPLADIRFVDFAKRTRTIRGNAVPVVRLCDARQLATEFVMPRNELKSSSSCVIESPMAGNFSATLAPAS